MKNYTFGETMKNFLFPLRENKRVLAYSLSYFLSDALVNIWLLYFFKLITDNIENWINIYFYIFMLLVICKLFIVFYFRHFFGWFYPTMRKYFYSKYLWEFLKIDNNKTETYWTGKVISIVEKWISVWMDQLTLFLRDFLWAWLNFLFTLFLVSSINYFYWIIIIFIISFSLSLLVFIQKLNRKYRLQRRESNIEISRRIVNFIISKFEILQNYKWNTEIKKISSLLDFNEEVNKKITNNYFFVDIFSNFIIFWTRIFIVLFFVYWFNKWLITIWEFVVFVSFSYILERTLTTIMQSYYTFSNNLVDIEKVWEFFDWKSIINGYETWKDFIYKNWEIEIKDLTFSYYDWKNIFENFDLKIDGWKITSFVWNSWSWKSTLIKLISWYIIQSSWKIIVDRQDLNEISLKSYYKNIWYLTQEPSVFDWTVIDNLTYAIDRELKKWELEKVIKDARCEFINDLPFWLETEIWERWVKLSWWQKQRLAIAKIMLKNPKIILLDEPTSALDSFSEEQITKALNNLFVWKTVIIIAHRLQTVKNADKILVFENGKVIEEWTHNSLVEKWWIYGKMLELQSGF